MAAARRALWRGEPEGVDRCEESTTEDEEQLSSPFDGADEDSSGCDGGDRRTDPGMAPRRGGCGPVGVGGDAYALAAADPEPEMPATEVWAYSLEGWLQDVRRARQLPGRTFVVMHLFAGERRSTTWSSWSACGPPAPPGACFSCRLTWPRTRAGTWRSRRRSTRWAAWSTRGTWTSWSRDRHAPPGAVPGTELVMALRRCEAGDATRGASPT